MKKPVICPLLLLAVATASAACSSKHDGYQNILPPTEAADASTSAGADDSAASGAATSSTGGVQTGLVPGAGQDNGAGSTTGGVLNPEDVCAAVSLETENIEREVPMEVTITTEIEVPEPVAIYIVLDNSGSMDDSPGGQNGSDTKWEQAEQALTDFVNDPASEGVDVAIQYFHPEGVGGNVDECDGIAHATPDVAMGALPDNAPAIVDSLGATGPDNDTPTVGALAGGINFCAQFQAQTPDEQCIVVLVTDGQPNACGLSSDCGGGGGGGNNDCVDPNSQAVLTPIASAGAGQGVTTFTVGMQGVTADGFDLLNAIAVAGGSDCTPATPGAEACDVSATGGAGLLEALNTIRDTVVVTETMTQTTTETIVESVTLPCQWSMPLAPAGETIDPSLVNVVLEVNGLPSTLGQVLTPADCASATAGGWYYDTPLAPTSIHVCPQTCAVVEGNADVRVQVELGCETQLAIPK